MRKSNWDHFNHFPNLNIIGQKKLDIFTHKISTTTSENLTKQKSHGTRFFPRVCYRHCWRFIDGVVLIGLGLDDSVNWCLPKTVGPHTIHRIGMFTMTLEVQDQTKNGLEDDPCKGVQTTKGPSFVFGLSGWCTMKIQPNVYIYIYTGKSQEVQVRPFNNRTCGTFVCWPTWIPLIFIWQFLVSTKTPTYLWNIPSTTSTTSTTHFWKKSFHILGRSRGLLEFS